MSDERKEKVLALFKVAPTIDDRRTRLEAARTMLSNLCNGFTRAWRMTIPVQPDDSDVVIGAALTDADASLKELEALTAKWDAIPWAEIDYLLFPSVLFNVRLGEMRDKLVSWYVEHSPPEPKR